MWGRSSDRAVIRFVDVDGVRLRTSARGSGSPVLLITGLGASLDLAEPFERELVKRGHQVVSFDAPGVGESTPYLVPRRMRGAAPNGDQNGRRAGLRPDGRAQGFPQQVHEVRQPGAVRIGSIEGGLVGLSPPHLQVRLVLPRHAQAAMQLHRLLTGEHREVAGRPCGSPSA